MEDYNTIVVLGATATGKTAYAVKLAQEKEGEIISADSRQVYKGLDLGTGKDLHEYGGIAYHLIDIYPPDKEYNVFNFQQDVYKIFPEIIKRNKIPIIVGGTGLYLDAIIRQYELIPVPENKQLRHNLKNTALQELQKKLLLLNKNVHNKTDLENHERLIRAIEIAVFYKDNPQIIKKIKSERPDIRPEIIGLRFKREELRSRIYKRLITRIDLGMIDEVQKLHEQGISWARFESLGLEYKITAAFLQKIIPTKDMYIETLYKAICQFAKRQETWFRRMERKGVKIKWLEL